MNHWVVPKLKPRGVFLGFDLGMAKCGTVACIAGRACGLFGNLANIQEESIQMLAQGMLELSDEQASCLFFQESWPNDLYARYELAASKNDHTAMARTASDAIDRFIEDWTQFKDQSDGEPEENCNCATGECAHAF